MFFVSFYYTLPFPALYSLRTGICNQEPPVSPQQIQVFLKFASDFEAWCMDVRDNSFG